MAKKKDKVFEAFEKNKYANAGPFHTIGGKLYSYNMCIAKKYADKVHVLDKSFTVSETTCKHIGYILSKYPDAIIVDSPVHLL